MFKKVLKIRKVTEEINNKNRTIDVDLYEVLTKEKIIKAGRIKNSRDNKSRIRAKLVMSNEVNAESNIPKKALNRF